VIEVMARAPSDRFEAMLQVCHVMQSTLTTALGGTALTVDARPELSLRECPQGHLRSRLVH
jgi:hypothetical protein